MMENDSSQISADMTVHQLLGRWPEAIPVFLRHRTACVGCSLAVFTTLKDVAETYNLDLPALIDEITQTILADQPS